MINDNCVLFVSSNKVALDVTLQYLYVNEKLTLFVSLCKKARQSIQPSTFTHNYINWSLNASIQFQRSLWRKDLFSHVSHVQFEQFPNQQIDLLVVCDPVVKKCETFICRLWEKLPDNCDLTVLSNLKFVKLVFGYKTWPRDRFPKQMFPNTIESIHLVNMHIDIKTFQFLLSLPHLKNANICLGHEKVVFNNLEGCTSLVQLQSLMIHTDKLSIASLELIRSQVGGAWGIIVLCMSCKKTSTEDWEWLTILPKLRQLVYTTIGESITTMCKLSRRLTHMILRFQSTTFVERIWEPIKEISFERSGILLHLEIDNSNINNNELFQIIENQPSLHTMVIYNCPNITIDIFYILGYRCPSLTTLILQLNYKDLMYDIRYGLIDSLPDWIEKGKPFFHSLKTLYSSDTKINLWSLLPEIVNGLTVIDVSKHTSAKDLLMAQRFTKLKSLLFRDCVNHLFQSIYDKYSRFVTVSFDFIDQESREKFFDEIKLLC